MRQILHKAEVDPAVIKALAGLLAGSTAGYVFSPKRMKMLGVLGGGAAGAAGGYLLQDFLDREAERAAANSPLNKYVVPGVNIAIGGAILKNMISGARAARAAKAAATIGPKLAGVEAGMSGAAGTASKTGSVVAKTMTSLPKSPSLPKIPPPLPKIPPPLPTSSPITNGTGWMGNMLSRTSVPKPAISPVRAAAGVGSKGLAGLLGLLSRIGTAQLYLQPQTAGAPETDWLEQAIAENTRLNPKNVR